MRKKFTVLLLLIIFTVSAVTAYSHNEENSDSDNSYSFISTERSEKELLSSMKKLMENDFLAFYIRNDEDLIAVENKKNHFIWWSSPINAGCDEYATNALKYELKSSLTLLCHNKGNSTFSLKSAKEADISYTCYEKYVEIIYDFTEKGITVPVRYSLGDDFLDVSVRSEKISEKNDMLIHELTLMNSFGAASENESGYFILPDGSGTVINFNNGKTNAEEYSAMVYGNDITDVPETYINTGKQQISLPVYGIVKQKNAVLAVAHDGDENACLHSAVSRQSRTGFNKCFFSFIMRESDRYYIGNTESPVSIYKNSRISNSTINMRYYIMNSSDISYCDIAGRYRKYLCDELGIEKKNFSDIPQVCIDFYGGTMKKKSFFGIPVYKKTCFTSFEQARQIIENTGIENIYATYRNWTDSGISHKADFRAVPADILGGNNAFMELSDMIEKSGGILYPVTENITFTSGNGLNMFFSTAMRVSGSYAKIPSYDYAYGIKDRFRKKYSLISPDELEKIYSEISDSYSQKGIENISLGRSLSVLYGDYGKKYISREDMKEITTDILEKLSADFDSISAECPNAYALPYVDFITDMPMCSSRYDITDYDIPFFQMVIHGLIPYSSIPLNSCSDYESSVIRAAAYGSILNYDLIYSEPFDFKDTEADIYFYIQHNNICDDLNKTIEIRKITGNCEITGFLPSENGFCIRYGEKTEILVENNSFTVRTY